MKKLILLIVLCFIANLGYSKEVNLLCRGTLSFNMTGVSDTKNKDLNFSFDETKETIITDGILMCINSSNLKSKTRQFTKQNIIVDAETEGKEPIDIDYCYHSFELNRNSGLLKTTKMENSKNIVVIHSGNFNCELAKQKF